MSDPASAEAKAVFAQYHALLDEFSAQCRAAPERWHSLAKEFSALRERLRPHAEAGDYNCQYALGTIAFLGLCCASEAEYQATHELLKEEATPWWIAAGRQGCWWAVDNLLSGKGPEADRARAVVKEVQGDSAHLIGHDAPTGMPIYGPEFMQEVTRRLYGVVRSGNDE